LLKIMNGDRLLLRPFLFLRALLAVAAIDLRIVVYLDELPDELATDVDRLLLLDEAEEADLLRRFFFC